MFRGTDSVSAARIGSHAPRVFAVMIVVIVLGIKDKFYLEFYTHLCSSAVKIRHFFY